MAKDSLFAILMRAPWWVSLVVAAALFAAVRLVLPAAAAAAAAVPFIGITIFAAWKQMRAPSATSSADMLAKLREMSWENFSAVIGEAFRRDGYEVTEVYKDAIDLELRKAGRRALVSCKRWKVAQTGIGPLRDLAAAKQAADADDCIYVAAGDFTANARTFAGDNGVKLLSGAALAVLVARVERGKRGWFRS